MQALSCVRQIDNCIKILFPGQLRIDTPQSGRRQQQQQRVCIGLTARSWGGITFRRQSNCYFNSLVVLSASYQGQEAFANAATSVEPAELTALLKNCSTFEQLLRLLVLHAPECNYINASAAYTHAAQLAVRLLGQQQQTVGHSQKTTVAPPAKQQLQLQQLQRMHQQNYDELLELLPPLLDVLLRHCGQFQGRQVSNSIWATQKLLHALLQQQQHTQQQKSAKLFSRLQEAMQLLLQQAKSCWHLYTGQELVLLLYSLARFTRHHLQSVSCHASSTAVTWSDSSIKSVADRAVRQLAKLQQKHQLLLKPQELEMLLIAFRLFQRPDLSQQPVHPAKALQEQQHAQKPQHQAGQHAGQNTGAAAKFELPVSLVNQLLVDVVKLHSRKHGKLPGQKHRRAARQPQSRPEPHGLSARDAAGLLYSCAVLGLPLAPATILQVLPRLQGRNLRRCKDVDLANILYALALLRFRPADRTWWSGVSATWQRLLQQRQFGATEQVVATFALARLRVKPRQALMDAAAAVLAKAFVDNQVGNPVLFLWSLGRLGARIQEETLQQVLQAYLTGCALAAAAPASAPGVEADAPIASLKMPAGPSHQQLIPTPKDILIDSADQPVPLSAAAAAEHLEVTSNQTGAASRQVPVVSKMQLPHQQQPQQQQQQQQHSLKQQAQEHGMVVWALGQLGFCPSKYQLRQLLQHTVLLAPYADARCLSSVLHGLGQLQYRPGRKVLQALMDRVLQVLQQQLLQQQTQPSFPQQKQHKGQSPRQQRRQQQEGRSIEMQSDVEHQQVHRGALVLQPGMAAFDSQGLIMALRGLVRVQPAPVLLELSQLDDVLVTAAQVMPAAPAAAGIVLWSAVKLHVSPFFAMGIVDATFRALRVLQKQGSKSENPRQHHRGTDYHHHNQQQQQQQQRDLQQQRHARSVALMLWGLARVGLNDTHRSKLAKSLHGLSAKLQHSNPVDLCSSIWALRQLQLRPPEPWMLQFYAASQANLQQFSDPQLATLAVSTYDVLLVPEQDLNGQLHGHEVMKAADTAQQQQQQQEENEQQQQQQQQQQRGSSIAQHARVLKPEADLLQPQQQQQQQQLDGSSAGPAQAPPQHHSAPPALWQLQLELQLRSRWKQRRAQQQEQQQLKHSRMASHTDGVVPAGGSGSTTTLPALNSTTTGGQRQQPQEAVSRQETDSKRPGEGSTAQERTADPLVAVLIVLRRWRQQSSSIGFDDGP